MVLNTNSTILKWRKYNVTVAFDSNSVNYKTVTKKQNLIQLFNYKTTVEI